MIGIILIACPPECAEQIASLLLEKRLVAAVNILPAIQSWYWWENSIQSTQEALLLVKTLRSQFQQIEQTVREVHPYQVPSIIMLPSVAGADDYVNWISQEVKASQEM